MRWLRLWRGWAPFVILVFALGAISMGSTIALVVGIPAFLLLLALSLFLAYENQRQLTAPLREARRIIQETMPPRCEICGYDLRASKDRCPECGTPTPPPDPLVYSPMLNRILERAELQARLAGLDYVGTEHVLLAIFNEPESVAATILDNFGVDEDLVRRWVDVVNNPALPVD